MSIDIYVDTFYGIILPEREAESSLFNLIQDEEAVQNILFDEDTELQKTYHIEHLKFFHIRDAHDNLEFCIAVPETFQTINVIHDYATRSFPNVLENIQNSLDEMKKLSSKEPQWHMTITYA